MRRKIFLAQVIIFVSCLLGSCNYLNVDDYFEDTFKEDMIFANKINIEKYFNGAVMLLPVDGKVWNFSGVPGITGSDEAVSCGTYNNGFINVQFPGTELTTNKISATSMSGWEWNFDVWTNCYKAIRKANTILPRIDEVPDMNSFDKSELRARTRFLRAYAYYWILQNQGPMIILDDKVLETNESPSYYNAYRSTYDQCVDYICSELEVASAGLDLNLPIDLFGQPTKGAALALVARLRLQAASPLYNGGPSAKKYFGNFKRKKDGVHYVSQTYDERKWAVAAAAAKRVIDLGIYKLHTVDADQHTLALPANVPSANYPLGAGGIDPFRSYSEMFTGESSPYLNDELIWGTDANIAEHLEYIFPIGLGGNSCVSVPQRVIDAFYMADGHEISNPSASYPYNNRPYDNTCIVQSDKILSKNYVLKAGTYQAYEGREPRFYANIGFSGAHWPMESTTETAKKNKVVKYHYGADYGKNASSNASIYNMTGYVCKKFVHPRDARAGAGARYYWKTFPIIRYAEILLSYAEALNNLTSSYTINGEVYGRNEQDIESAFNLVRFRAGLPGVSSEELSSITAFNNVIQRERLIEFLHENRRYYDIRRWGIIEALEASPLTGMNVDADEWNGFYAPTIISHKSIRERVFSPKLILLPLTKNELRKVPTLDQNPGWDN